MPRTYQFDPPNNQAVKDAAETAVFGHTLANNDFYADLIGDIIGDGVIRVFFNKLYGQKNKIYPITISGKTSIHSSVVRLDDGEFNYSDCKVVSKGSGIGRLVFLRVARTAKALDFTDTIEGFGDKITNHPNPDNNAWGFSVYPTYGFDCDIPANVVLPQNLAHFTRVLALNDDPTGRVFWKANGEALATMVFTLANGSPSWNRLRRLW